jgi:hypothetical protein
MIPMGMKAGSMGLKILKTLYKGKAKIGKGSAYLADKAGKAKFTGTSKAITGASKKVHKGTRYLAKEIKKNPKVSSFIAGGLTYNIFDND